MDLNARKTIREPRVLHNARTILTVLIKKILTKQTTHSSHKRRVNEKFALIYKQIKMSARDIFAWHGKYIKLRRKLMLTFENPILLSSSHSLIMR